MNDAAPFEAKLEEHLLTIRTAAQAAKVRIAQGVAGLSKPQVVEAASATYAAEAPLGARRSAVNFGEPTSRVEAPSFDPAQSEISDGSSDDEGIPVWEDPV